MSVLKGHIRLGGRDYMIEWPQYQKSLANPFAAKLGSGAGKYDDLEDWSAWVMDDWTGGLGKLANDGGILWGDSETRFQNRLILGPQVLPITSTLQSSNAPFYVDGIIEGELSVGTTEAYSAAVIYHKTLFSRGTNDYVWILIRADKGTSIDVDMYTAFQGSSVQSETLTALDSGMGYYYIAVPVDSTGSNPAYIKISPTTAGDTVHIPWTDVSDPSANGDLYTASGSTWTTYQPVSTAARGFFICKQAQFYTYDKVGFIHRFPGQAHFSSTLTDVVVVSGSNINGIDGSAAAGLTTGTQAAFASGTPTNSIFWNGTLYIGYGSSQDIETWDGTTPLVTPALTGIKSDLLFSWNGYLYRALDYQLWYTSDGTTWSGPFDIGTSDYPVTGMAAMGPGNGIIVSTTEGLYQFAEGDFVFGIKPFGSISDVNGRGMANYNGDLYIPYGGGIYRMTSTFAISDVWISEEEDLPAARLGNIRTLSVVNSFLFALVDSGETGKMSTLLAYDGQAWHHIATFPEASTGRRLFYDRETNILFITTGEGLIYYMYIPDQSSSPLRDASYKYSAFAWMETDWYDGDLIEIVKDFESIYIDSDDISNGSVKVYWQDVDSTAWELLGTVTADGEEIIWSDFATRPQTRKIKLGVLVTTNDNSKTPVIRAIRAKYHNMVNDRYRWQLVLKAEDNQQMFDKTVNQYSADEMRVHINTMVTQTLPVKFVDVDGTSYNVKVQQDFETIEKLERVNQSRRYDSKHTLTLSQV